MNVNTKIGKQIVENIGAKEINEMNRASATFVHK